MFVNQLNSKDVRHTASPHPKGSIVSVGGGMRTGQEPGELTNRRGLGLAGEEDTGCGWMDEIT